MQNLDQLIECFSNPKLSLPLTLNFMQIQSIKIDLAVVESFPTVIILGAPTTGKTPLALACLVDAIKFGATDSPRRTQKQYMKAENCIIIDDFCDFSSRTQRENVTANFENIIRDSYNGNAPISLLTAETGAISKLIKSAKERMIPLAIGQGIKEQSFSCLLKYLQRTKQADLRKLLNEFKEFYMESAYREKLYELLDSFREKYGEIATDDKRLNMVFCYYYVVLILNELLVRHNAMTLIPIETLVEEYLTITLQEVDALVESKSWTERVFERALEMDLFRPQCPVPKDVCLTYMKNGCTESNRCEECNVWPNSDIVHSYALEDLVLQYGSNTNCLLLMNTAELYYAKRLSVDECVLIVDSNTLLEIMNSVGTLRYKETGEKRDSFTSQRLHVELYKNNRCMAHANGDSFRYTMGYPAEGLDGMSKVKNVRVVVLRLKQEEALRLFQINKEDSGTRLKYTYDSSTIAYTLSKVWGGMMFSYGDIGKSS